MAKIGKHNIYITGRDGIVLDIYVNSAGGFYWNSSQLELSILEALKISEYAGDIKKIHDTRASLVSWLDKSIRDVLKRSIVKTPVIFITLNPGEYTVHKIEKELGRRAKEVTSTSPFSRNRGNGILIDFDIAIQIQMDGTQPYYVATSILGADDYRGEAAEILEKDGEEFYVTHEYGK